MRSCRDHGAIGSIPSELGNMLRLSYLQLNREKSWSSRYTTYCREGRSSGFDHHWLVGSTIVTDASGWMASSRPRWDRWSRVKLMLCLNAKLKLDALHRRALLGHEARAFEDLWSVDELSLSMRWTDPLAGCQAEARMETFTTSMLLLFLSLRLVMVMNQGLEVSLP